MNDIIHLFYGYLVDFVKMWIIFMGLLNYTPQRKKKVYIVAGSVQCILLITAGILRRYSVDAVTIFNVCMLLLSICFLFEGRFLKKFIYSLLTYILILFLETCVIGIASALNIYPEADSLYHILLRFIYKTIIFVPLLLLLIKKKRKSYSKVRLSKSIFAFLFIGAGTGIFFISALLVSLNSKISDNGRKLLIVITIIIVITYCLTCFMMMLITESRDNYKALSLISQSVIESQQKYYTLVNEKQKEIHSIRHEMKNHLACIHGLYQSNKLNDMEAYLKQLIETSNTPADLFDTGNDIVNAILNDVQSRYRSDNILIRLEGGFPEPLYIAPMDLCVIFANIIINAVEAIQKIEPKNNSNYYIDVSIKNYKDDLYIDVKNPIIKDVEVYNGTLQTSKKDKSLHGFGVKNVIDRVEKYQGTYNFKMHNNEFEVTIFMKNRLYTI